MIVHRRRPGMGYVSDDQLLAAGSGGPAGSIDTRRLDELVGKTAGDDFVSNPVRKRVEDVPRPATPPGITVEGSGVPATRTAASSEQAVSSGMSPAMKYGLIGGSVLIGGLGLFWLSRT